MEQLNFLTVIATIVSELLIIAGAVIPVIVWVTRIVDGQRCQLRTAMLNTYYHCRDKETIRQYERENFDKLYAAYKKLGGNSFVDDIYREIRSYTVIT